MAVVYDNTQSSNAVDAVGGSLSADDDVVFSQLSATFTSADFDAVELNSMTFAPTFTGRTAPGVNILVNLDGATYDGNLVVNHRGGDLGIAASDDGSAGTIARAVVNDTGSGILYFNGGTVSVIEQSGGDVRVNSSTAIGATVNLAGGNLRAESHASDVFGTVNVTGPAQLYTERAGTTFNLFDRNARATFVDAAPTNLNIWAGTVIYAHSANLANVVVGSFGTLDLRQIDGDMTLGATVYPGARILLPTSFTVTETLTRIANAEPRRS
jgi:hypothetical protein